MAHQPFRVVHDAWDTYVVATKDGPLFISFDDEAARNDLTATLANCARVIVPIQNPNANGGPVSPEAERLYEMEDALVAKLTEHEVRCRLVGRLTCKGTREIVFQLDDWEEFRPPVGLWMMDNEDYAIDVSEHEGWGFFNDCIRPSEDDWLFIADRNVVQGLLEAGSDPEKEHALEFEFQGPSQGLQRLAAVLEGKGYRRLGDIADDQAVLVRRMKLDLDEIVAASRFHTALAKEHGVACGGWGCEVVR